MAGKANENTEKSIEVTAKVNLKYDNEIKKIGEKLEIRESDLEELRDNGYIDYTPPANQTPNTNQTAPPPANADGK